MQPQSKVLYSHNSCIGEPLSEGLLVDGNGFLGDDKRIFEFPPSGNPDAV